MNQSPFDFMSYKIVSRCPMCNTAANNTKVEMLEESPDGLVLIYSRCNNCNIGLIANLSLMHQGMYGAAILTELDKHEVGKFASSKPISADEIMDYVSWLKK